MTGKERVDRMFRREEQDSVPRCDTWWDETVLRWRTEGFAGDLPLFVGNDFHPLSWSDPRPFVGRQETVAEDGATRTYLDEWGNTVRYWKCRSGTPEHVAFGCRTREDWETTYKPKLLESWPFVKPAASFEDFAVGRRNGRWTYLCGLETFEMTRRQVGDETFLMALIEDPEWAVDMSQTMSDLVLRDFELLLETGMEPDGVWIYGDMAYRGGPMCSPSMYRELVWPDHHRMAQWAHDHGLPFIFHTDGNVNSLVPDYIAAGFDCLQPLEAKAGMDVRLLAPAVGDRLALFGNIDVMTMATNDRDLIEEEVVSKLRAGMKGAGYVYHSDHSVPPSVTWDTYKFILDLVDCHGNYGT